MAKFSVGDKVKLSEKYHSGRQLPKELQYNKEYEVTRTFFNEPNRVGVDYEDNGDIGWYQERFEKVEDKPVNQEAAINMESTGAMGFETARKLRQRIIDEAGISKDSIRLDTRSWDNEGRFAAIVIETALKQTTHRLVHPKQVADYLASQKPIDITPYMESTRLGVKVYAFRNPVTNVTFRMNGTEWFTEADVKNAGGIVIHEGKRYRPGVNKFVPFLETSK